MQRLDHGGQLGGVGATQLRRSTPCSRPGAAASRYRRAWSARSGTAGRAVVTRAGSIFCRPGRSEAYACCAPSTLPAKSTRSMWLKASSSPVILVFCTSSIRSAAPLARSSGLYCRGATTVTSLPTLPTSSVLSAFVAGGDRVALPQVAFDGVEALPAHLGVDRGGLAHVDQVVEVARVVVDGEAGQDEALDAGLGALVERSGLGVCRSWRRRRCPTGRRRRAP